MKQVMPVRPAARTNEFIRFVTWLNATIWQEALCLPLMEPLAQELEGFGFVSQVLLVGSAVIPEGLRGAVGPRNRVRPADAVEALMEHITGPGDKVVILPHPQAVRRTVGSPAVTTQHIHRRGLVA